MPDLVTPPINEGSSCARKGVEVVAQWHGIQAMKMNSGQCMALVMGNVQINYDTKHNSCDKKRELLHGWSRLLV